MTDYTNLKLSIDGHTATVTLNNPPAHTWTMDSLPALKQLVTDLNANDDVYALIIHGDGEKFFSAGADLNNFSDGDKGRAISMAIAFGNAFEALSAYRGVSIAVINGYAMGGGLECALACDIRIAEAHAQMALPEAGVGLLPCAGGTQNLTALVGEGWAKRMILCGERVDAETALRIGLVEEVAAKGEGLQAAQALAKKSLSNHPLPLVILKHLFKLLEIPRLRKTLSMSAKLLLNCLIPTINAKAYKHS